MSYHFAGVNNVYVKKNPWTVWHMSDSSNDLTPEISDESPYERNKHISHALVMILKAQYPQATTINVTTKSGCYSWCMIVFLEGRFGKAMLEVPINPAL